MLTDFQNSFADRFSGRPKFATNPYLNIPPHMFGLRVRVRVQVRVGVKV